MSAMTRIMTAALIGAPTDVGASVRGASMGPEALRVAGIERALRSRGATVVDSGNLSGPANPEGEPIAGYRHLAEVATWARAVRDATRAALSSEQIPILLGGDHSLAIGSIAAVAHHCRSEGRRLRVLWLDAHADFNTPQLSPSGNLHGMPLACLCGFGPRELLGEIGVDAALLPSQVCQIGVRSVDSGERALLHEHGIEVLDMRTVDEIGMRAVMEHALADVDANTHLHVSLDVDFLDSELAPGVATAVPGGPTYREAQLCMEMIADTGRMGSLDIVELNPALDHRNRTAVLAVDLIESLFGKSTLVRPAASPQPRSHWAQHRPKTARDSCLQP
jgi:arginase